MESRVHSTGCRNIEDIPEHPYRVSEEPASLQPNPFGVQSLSLPPLYKHVHTLEAITYNYTNPQLNAVLSSTTYSFHTY
ncbi:hypothetical protein J6590_102154 [Homalodisca vitripennis]|nr:hypothetical protein J6590_102154 [Homalodisca vitripennis]